MNPDKKSYQLNKAICLTNLYRYDEAEQILFRLNYEDADNLEVARVLAWALTGNGKYEQAGRLYDQLMAQEEPEDSDYINYGFYLWFTGRIDDTANCFRTDVMDSKFIGESWKELTNIIYRESGLLEKKGITKREMNMMIDLTDVYDA